MRKVVSFTTRMSLLAIGAVILGSCTVAVEEPRPGRPDPGPGMCTREYSPVCARRGGDRRTFSNACMADVAGYRVIRRGECRSERPPQQSEVSCTAEYRPVCAVRGQQVRDFPNACEAGLANFRVVGEGPC